MSNYFTEEYVKVLSLIDNYVPLTSTPKIGTLVRSVRIGTVQKIIGIVVELIQGDDDDIAKVSWAQPIDTTFYPRRVYQNLIANEIVTVQPMPPGAIPLWLDKHS